jgi:aminoglycoside phosphotransferase (APT) family kinase protein
MRSRSAIGARRRVTGGIQPERGYGWLAAVIPRKARRFRVADPILAAQLSEAGADLLGTAPDVEIASVRQLRGDGAVSIAVLGRPARDGRPFPVRVVRRLANAARVQLEARRARRAVSRLGYASVAVITWDYQRTLRDHRMRRGERRFGVAEYLPQRALVVGGRQADTRTLLDASLADAGEAMGLGLEADWPMIRSGLLIVDTNVGILRVAVGPGSRQIHNQRAALAALAAAAPSSVVAQRVPWELAAGRCGLAEWSLERRLPGTAPRRPVSGRLLAECLDFLVALHRAGASASREGAFLEQVEVVTEACTSRDARRVRALGETVEAALPDVPRGFAHGDFFHGNLLVERGKLVGVADWDAAGPGRLPLIDLLHLKHTSARELADLDWGPELVRRLVPWARAGGDDVVRTYCQRIGFEIDGKRLDALTMAYWLDYVSYRLRTHAHQRAEPLWAERNIGLVLETINSLPRVS